MNISKILLLCGGCALLNSLNVNAQRPIIQTKYTADPAPMVYNDTVFLYPSAYGGRERQADDLHGRHA